VGRFTSQLNGMPAGKYRPLDEIHIDVKAAEGRRSGQTRHTTSHDQNAFLGHWLSFFRRQHPA
jgi:hypothetical protein